MKTSMIVAFASLLFAGAASASAPPAAPAHAPLHIAPLQYHYRQLPNGLRVYAMPDRTTANVAIQVWYRVGSRDDPAGRSGFAHLFEHMLFKTTRDMPDGMFFQMTTDVGGTFNGSTHADYTDYWEIAPANHLQRLLWAESQRMGSLVVDPAGLESETDVVKEELRQRVLAAPYGRLFYLYMAQANFGVHPYGRPGIGSIEDLESATIGDVRAFHATYYRPDNAVMVVAGNFDLNQFNAWVDQYFGPIARPERPIPRVTAVEPVRQGPRNLTAYAPNVPLPAVLATYIQPPSSSPDIPVIYLIDAILQQGQSSRLYRSLVYERQVASQILTNWEPTIDPGAYSVGAILSAGKTVEEGEAALLAELARLRDAPVSLAELDEAKNEIITTTLQGRETAFGRSAEIAGAVVQYGDPAAADRILAAIQRVTAADVQRVARTLFDDNRRVVIRYLGEESRPAGVTGDVIESSPNIQARQLTPPSGVPVYSLAPEAERVAPPPPSAPVNARIPALSERTLANGLRVIVAPQHALPLVSASLRALGGSASDPAGRNGAAGLTTGLLTRGTASRTATQIAAEIESLGATLNSATAPDFSEVSLQARSDRTDRAFAILSDVVRNPALAEAELVRERQQALDTLTVSLRQPGGIASLAMNRAIFGAAPYGGVASPTTLRAVTRSDVVALHRASWRPDNALLVITGDVTPQQGFALAERHFGSWPRPATPPTAAPDASASAAAPRTIVVDLPQTGQAAVQMGVRGVSRRDGNYFDTLLATAVLGGGATGRLNQEIRVRRGLSYGAYAGLSARAAPSPIVAATQTRNDAAVQVVQLMEAEIARMRDALTPAEELDRRKSTLIGAFGRSVETTAGLAGQIATMATFGVPAERLNTYVADLNRVTPEQVRTASRLRFDPAHMDLVVVGDARLFYDDLLRIRPNAERIPVTELNLDREALR